MREKFRDIRMSKRNKLKLEGINGIIEEYRQGGYVLTLRQLYYQLVSRAVIDNKQTEYRKLSVLLKEGRMAGIVDWDSIEDRLRVPQLPYWCHDPQGAVDDAANQYRVDRQKGQRNYTEVWVEKDALSGVLSRVTEKYHVRLLVNRGYGSATAIHDAYRRFMRVISNDDSRKVNLLYLGDHDPSGLDMIRDVRVRISEMMLNSESNYYFNDSDIDDFFSVKHIGLTTDQIRKYRPPENPAKVTDPRAKWYTKNYGHSSWEVDALNPKVLNELLVSEIESLMDMDLYNHQLDLEENDIKSLENVSQKFKQITEFFDEEE